MFRVVRNDSAVARIREPPDAFEATGNEEPCVERDTSHSCEDSRQFCGAYAVICTTKRFRHFEEIPHPPLLAHGLEPDHQAGVSVGD